jgi:predicted Zn-dependent protease
MPTNMALYDEAISLQEKGSLDEAVGKLHELLGQDPNCALAHAALSRFYSLQGKHDEAVEHGRKMCEMESDDPFSFVALSLVCQKAGRISDAEQAMMQARQAYFMAQQRDEP